MWRLSRRSGVRSPGIYGWELLSQFMERGLIDEITVNVVPVILGNGYTLFSRNRMEQSWDMACFQCFDNGVMQMRYVPRT